PFPFLTIDVAIAVAVELREAFLDRAGRHLFEFEHAVLVGVVLLDHLVERRYDDDVARIRARAPAGDIENVAGADTRRHVADARHAAHGPDLLARVEIIADD